MLVWGGGLELDLLTSRALMAFVCSILAAAKRGRDRAECEVWKRPFVGDDGD